jgi:hypothetical protein
LVRMTIGIICPHANHRHFRVNCGQKVLGSGCVAAMMGHLGDQNSIDTIL